MRKVYLAGAVRTPIGNFLGSLSQVKSATLAAIVIREALEKAQLQADEIDEVIMGCVLQGGLGQNVARQAVLKAGLPIGVPAQTINMVCGSGLRAVVDAARLVASGEADAVIAGGVESMSGAPYLLAKARTGLKMGHVSLDDLILADGLTCAVGNHHMGITAETVAKKFHITRQQQDEFACQSQMKAAKAMEENKFADEIIPVVIPHKKGDIIVDKDEFPRPSTTMESLAKLKPAFQSDGTVTAGNASGINDGASAMVVLSEEKAKKLTGAVNITDWAYAGLEPELMGLGPVYAVRKLLQKTGLTLDEMDVIEANEAFASQSIAVGMELGWYQKPLGERVNVNGGAIALGHPIGASGARILTTLIHEMQRRSSKRGLATLCIGGGMGISLAVEAQ